MQETVERCVVTGAGGFLGRHLTRALVQHGLAVTGTTRTEEGARQAGSAIGEGGAADIGRLAFVQADLEADAGWVQTMRGADVLFHTASPFPASTPADPQDVIRPAVEGTRRVLHAAADAGIRRVILTSSIAAVMYGDGTPPYDERNWTTIGGPFTTAYYASKTLAEREAWEIARDRHLDLTVFCPGMILGPTLGRTVATSVGIVRNLLNGKYPAMPKFTVPVVDVRDVAAAHVAALRAPLSGGERFVLAGSSLSVVQMVALLREEAPERAGRLPRITVPSWAARLASPFDRGLAMISAELGRDNRVSSDKARRMLGWTSRPERDMLRDTARSLIEMGLVT